MKTILLHGDDVIRSYDRLVKFIEAAKKRNWEINYLDDTTVSIPASFLAGSLFGGERFFVLRNVKKISKNDLEWIRDNGEKVEGTLIVYVEGELGKTLGEFLPKDTKSELFALPVIIWSFLDGISPGNTKMVLKTFHKLIETNPPEFLMSLISKHFRNMYWSIADANTLRLPDWRMKKLQNQAQKFGETRLARIIFSLSDIDIMAKTGRGNLGNLLDLLFIEILE